MAWRRITVLEFTGCHQWWTWRGGCIGCCSTYEGTATCCEPPGFVQNPSPHGCDVQCRGGGVGEPIEPSERFAAVSSSTGLWHKCTLPPVWLVERLVATCRSLTAVVRAQVTVGSLVAMYNAALCLDKLAQSRAAREVLEHVASEIASCPAAGVRCVVLWDLAVFLTSESMCSCARAGPRIICGMGLGLCFSGRATVERGVGAAASHARRNTVHGRTIFGRMRAQVAVGHAAQACTTEVVTATSHTPSAACPGVAAVW